MKRFLTSISFSLIILFMGLQLARPVFAQYITFHTVTVNVRKIADPSVACNSTAGDPVIQGSVNLATSSIPAYSNTIALNNTTNIGRVQFTSVPENNNYELKVSNLETGYGVIKKTINGTSTPLGRNGLKFNLTEDKTATFCIGLVDAWYQTSLGDVRFNSILNPISLDDFGSIGENTANPSASIYPGIFFSSETNGSFGAGEVSSKRWKVDSEYDYNDYPSSRNGTFSYSFFKSKAKQEGIAIIPLDFTLPPPTLQAKINSGIPGNGGGVLESNSTLVIGDDLNISGPRRVVILVNGNVEIKKEIKVNNGSLLIIAASGDIIIDGSVGTATLDSRAPQLEGYFSAEGDIAIDRDPARNCAVAPAVPDKRLNVGGALIANSIKPFSDSGAGQVVINRNLCTTGNENPALFVTSRLDFVTQLTDFHKITYTKWEEARP